MNRLLIMFVLAGMPAALWAQQPLAADRVAQALEQGLCSVDFGGVQVEPGSVRVLHSAAGPKEASSLRLVHLQSVRQGEFLATLRCPSAKECLPFLVAFRCRECIARAPGRRAANAPQSPMVAVRAGEQARLELAVEGGKLWFPVVCMEAGAVGEVVRSRMTGDHRTWAAVVVGAGQLQALESRQ